MTLRSLWRKYRRWLAVSLASLLVVVLVAAVFVPLVAWQLDYCFYCGLETRSVQVMGQRILLQTGPVGFYDEPVTLPAHQHRMITCTRVQFWLYHGAVHEDEFGWTGSPCHRVLAAALAVQPERREQIIAEFLALDPDDGAALSRFYDQYRAPPP
jgi:hypothetical protein